VACVLSICPISKYAIELVVMQVFRELKRRRLPEYKVGVTYVEIYNESFRDLLVPETKSSDIGVSEKK